MSESRKIKLSFLTRQECALADERNRILTQVEAELVRRPSIERAASLEEADAVIIQEAVSSKNWRHVETLLRDPIVGRYPEKIYTINADDSATGLLRGIYTSLRKRRFDPAYHRAMPYSLYQNEVVLDPPKDAIEAPAYLASWRGNHRSSRVRSRLLQGKLFRNPRFKLESTNSWMNHTQAEKEYYVRVMLGAKFSLCPAGWAPGSYRIYESMALRRSPVILADEYVTPTGTDWSKFSLTVAENATEDLPKLLESIEAEAEARGELAHAEWTRLFSPEKVYSFCADALLECIQSRTREEEVARWKSIRMRWANQWTPPQRAWRKLGRVLSPLPH